MQDYSSLKIPLNSRIYSIIGTLFTTSCKQEDRGCDITFYITKNWLRVRRFLKEWSCIWWLLFLEVVSEVTSASTTRHHHPIDRCALFCRGRSEAVDDGGARVRVWGQCVRLGEPLQGLPVLLVPGGHRRLPPLPEGMLQHLRAEHDDLQDPGFPGPEGGVLPRAPVQPKHHRAASCPRYCIHLTFHCTVAYRHLWNWFSFSSLPWWPHV